MKQSYKMLNITYNQHRRIRTIAFEREESMIKTIDYFLKLHDKKKANKKKKK